MARAHTHLCLVYECVCIYPYDLFFEVHYYVMSLSLKFPKDLSFCCIDTGCFIMKGKKFELHTRARIQAVIRERIYAHRERIYAHTLIHKA